MGCVSSSWHFSHVSRLHLAWIKTAFLLIISRSGSFGPGLSVTVNQLVMPTQVLLDRGNPFIAQQFL